MKTLAGLNKGNQMNNTDREMMVREYDRASDEAQRTFESSIINLQASAYAMGYERSKLNTNRAILVIEQTLKAIDADIEGTGTKMERMNGIEEAYAELETLLEELSE